MTAAVEDPGRVLLRDFALIDGNDWFQIPLAVPVGSKVDIASLSGSDTFGITTPIPHYSTVDGPSGRWRMFALSAQPGDLPVITSAAALPYELLVTPSAVARMDAAPIEEVLLLRDEIANVSGALRGLRAIEVRQNGSIPETA